MAFFQPVLRILPSGDLKTYTLEATVLVPTGCYIANGVASGWPAGMSGTPETEPIQLLIARRKGFCTEALQQLRFVKRGIPVTVGKTALVAYAMLDDEDDGIPNYSVVGVASIATPHSEGMMSLKLEPSAPAKSGAWIGSGEVSGWINRMPPGPARIHIRVGMWAPTSGYKYQLKAIGPFGFTGLTLLCEMHATRPSGMVLQVFTHTVVKHDGELGPKQNYTSVAVAFEGSLQIGPLTTVS